MNEWLAYILVILNPIAFILGFILTMQVWALRRNGKPNPVCMVIAGVLFAYQARNLITAIAVWYYSIGLVRPTGLLVWSLAGRIIEMTGSTLGLLYFAGKVGPKDC